VRWIKALQKSGAISDPQKPSKPEPLPTMRGYATASLAAFTGRALMIFGAAFALKIVGSLVNGLTPCRAFVAGFLMTTNLANPGTTNAPVFLSSLWPISATVSMTPFTSFRAMNEFRLRHQLGHLFCSAFESSCDDDDLAWHTVISAATDQSSLVRRSFQPRRCVRAPDPPLIGAGESRLAWSPLVRIMLGSCRVASTASVGGSLLAPAPFSASGWGPFAGRFPRIVDVLTGHPGGDGQGFDLQWDRRRQS
jgi:hypothetical protein